MTGTSALRQLDPVAQVSTDRQLPVGGRTVGTPQLTLFTSQVPGCLRKGGLLVVDGAPGNGKSHARRLLLEHLAPQAVGVQVRQKKSHTVFLRDVYRQLEPHTDTSYMGDDTLDRDIQEMLHTRKLALALDEAHRLRESGFSQIQEWFDDAPDPGLPMFVFGTGIAALIDAHPWLRRRKTGVITFQPLADNLLIAALHEFHPLLAHTPDPVLFEINRVFAGGSWGLWAQLLNTIIAQAGRGPRGVAVEALEPTGGLNRDMVFKALLELGETAAIVRWQLR